jgi:hypothetical protein
MDAMRYRTVGWLMGLAVGLVACGGAGDQGSQPPGASTAGVASDAAGDPGAGGPDDSYGSAVFVLDGTPYEFAIHQFGCSRREAELSARGDAADGSEDSFSVTLPLTVEDWDSRSAHRLRFSTPGSRWEAIGPSTEGAAYEGPRVDDFEVAGTTVSGTFWVVDREAFPTIADLDSLELVAGTFEVTCNQW